MKTKQTETKFSSYNSPVTQVLLLLMKSLRVGFIGLVISAASTWAANSALEGIVKDPTGKPVKGAEIHIEAKDGSNVSKIVRTNSDGRYACNGLAIGTYQVTLFVNRSIKASINNTKTQSDKPTQLNFDLKTSSVSNKPLKKHTHMVYMPAETGSNLGGRWVEVDDNGDNAAAKAGANNLQQTVGSTMLKQVQGQSGSNNANPHSGP